MEKTASFAGKRFRRYSVAVFAALIFTLVFSAFVSADNIPITLKTTKDQLNIRMAPDTYSELLTVIEQKGTVLYPVEKASANWYKIRFADDIYGYVFTEYVSAGDPVKSSVSLFPGAAIRVQPSGTAAVQKMCSIETELTISQQDSAGKWYYVTSFNGEKGYMLKSSVKALNVSYPSVTVPGAEVEKISLVEVNANSGKVREKPTTGSAIVTTLTRGQLLSVIGEVKGSDGHTWYKIKINGGKEAYVRDDVVKSYDPSHLKGKVIVIDPGHGCLKSANASTIDNGNIGVSGTLEKDVNLAVSRYLESYLKSAGATVVMTRETDIGVMTLEDRAKIANDNKAGALVSVHCNYSTKDKEKRGVLTYYYSGGNPKSGTLAGNLQNALSVELNAKNLGTASDKFTVLVKATVPASLIELGYISNTTDDALLKTESYQMLCAQGLYKGILKYFE